MTVPISQGTINRLRGSVVFAQFPELTVTAAYLAKEAINLNFEGEAAQKIGTLTGAVDSPEPYQMATIEIHLLKSQNLSNAFKSQIEDSTSVGSVNVIGDADAMDNWQIEQCVLQRGQPGAFDGNSATYVVRLLGVYYVNRQLWAST